MEYSSSGKPSRLWIDLIVAIGILCRKIPSSDTKSHGKADTAKRGREVEDRNTLALNIIDVVGVFGRRHLDITVYTRNSIWSLLVGFLEHMLRLEWTVFVYYRRCRRE